MYKIFTVEKGSIAERAVTSLVNLGSNYIPTFEKETGIIHFCLDLEVVTDGFTNTNLFIIVDGFSDNLTYQNYDLQEITVEKFKESVTKAFSVKGAGTNRLLQEMGYQILVLNTSGNDNLVPIQRVS